MLASWPVTFPPTRHSDPEPQITGLVPILCRLLRPGAAAGAVGNTTFYSWRDPLSQNWGREGALASKLGAMPGPPVVSLHTRPPPSPPRTGSAFLFQLAGPLSPLQGRGPGVALDESELLGRMAPRKTDAPGTRVPSAPLPPTQSDPSSPILATPALGL